MPGGLFCAIGNPLNDGTWTYTWQNGCHLQKMQKNGETVEFVYNETGLRVQKTATTTGATKYTLHGKNIVHMTQGNNELHFFYDAQNKPAVVFYDGTPYSYMKNLQGDIVAILDSNKNVVVSYVYDAWGRPISKTGSMASALGTMQPFRYRGYVYDEELRLYYLRSRYYAPRFVRFINADQLLSLKHTSCFEKNLFTYCLNRAIVAFDDCGTEADFLIDDEPDILDDQTRDVAGGPPSASHDLRGVGTSTNRNPHGRVGGLLHQETLANTKDVLIARGLSVTLKEQKVTIDGGLKDVRYGDGGIYDSNGNLVGVIQVGKVNIGNGIPVSREMKAIYDFNLMELYVVFVPYNARDGVYMIFMP